MRTAYIYFLSKEGRPPFYVGQTEKIVHRWAAHLDTYGNDTEINTLEKVDYNLRFYWEQFYIDLFRSWGCVLENKDRDIKMINPKFLSYDVYLNKKPKKERERDKTILLLQKRSRQSQEKVVLLRSELERVKTTNESLMDMLKEKDRPFKNITNLEEISEDFLIQMRMLLLKKFVRYAKDYYPKSSNYKWFRRLIRGFEKRYTHVPERKNNKTKLLFKNSKIQMKLFED